MEIRKATKAELPIIISLLADDELGKLREKFTDPLPEPYYQAFDQIEKDPNQELVVAEDETGNIVGTLQLTFIQYLNYCGGLRAQIESVRVRKDMRKIGLGEKMIVWAIERAKERNVNMVQLTSDKQRPNAIRFYQRLGFVASHEGLKLHF